ncbi:MAG: tRNA 2-thiouridine(34) synthase MnmA [Candidatus Taylorbacteria bacterium]
MKSQGEKRTKKVKKKVYVGMSGGVDSSVSAAMLKKQGYDVIGVFIKVWQPDWIDCTWREDRLDAMRVAALLDIPFITLNLEKEYKKDVIDSMIAEYKAGRTPNPDVMCNKAIKFGGFYDFAMKKGADFVATGHYAQVTKHITRNTKQLRREKDFPLSDVTSYKLHVACDSNKDQSYFLWTLTQRELSRTLFPVGHLSKPEVRKMAKQFALPTAEKKDSQGLCFIGKMDMREFLGHYLKHEKGKVLSGEGKVIGEHDGAFFYTEGERHGYIITEKSPNDEPFYVVGKNVRANTITVGHREPPSSGNKEKIVLKNVNWILQAPLAGKEYRARIRYRQELAKCRVMQSGNTFSVVFFEKQQAVSAGQSLVLYDGEVCLGGGVIV